MSFIKSIAMLSIAGFAATLVACSSGPEIRSDADPSANLSSYKTFGFFDRVATDNSGYTTILTQHLKSTTQREMEKRGYKLVTTNPELQINFNVNIEDKTKIQSSPSMSMGVGYYGYRSGMYGAWGGYPQDIQTVNYQEGTLAIDVVDAAKQKLVWEGVAQGRVKKEGLQNPGPAIDRVVTSIFAKYPVPAAITQ